MIDSAMPQPVADTSPITKQELLQWVLGGMPIGLLNLLLASCLREGPALMQPLDKNAVPAELASAAMPAPTNGEVFLPVHNGQWLPNFAGSLAAVLPLLEEVRQKFPRFHYRLSPDLVVMEGEVRPGFKVETAEPSPTNPTEMVIRVNSNGVELPLVAAFATLEYMLDQPGVLARATFPLNVKRGVAPAPDGAVPATQPVLQ